MKTKRIFWIGCIALMLAGCKPTEMGYKQAYDAAKAKREYVDPDMELLTGGHKLLGEDASNWKTVGNDTLQMKHMFISPTDRKAWPQKGPYRLAVAMFKMDTNANSLVNDMSTKGALKPIVATDGKGSYYIIAGSAEEPELLAATLAEFKRLNPGFTYIGMTPAAPAIIFSR